MAIECAKFIEMVLLAIVKNLALSLVQGSSLLLLNYGARFT
jgi:hypothetical protein